jgi:hypothetical protein
MLAACLFQYALRQHQQQQRVLLYSKPSSTFCIGGYGGMAAKMLGTESFIHLVYSDSRQLAGALGV